MIMSKSSATASRDKVGVAPILKTMEWKYPF
jgi:hypothetical protein